MLLSPATAPFTTSSDVIGGWPEYLGWRASFPSGLSECFRNSQLCSRERRAMGRKRRGDHWSPMSSTCSQYALGESLEISWISFNWSNIQGSPAETNKNRVNFKHLVSARQPSPLKTQAASMILASRLPNLAETSELLQTRVNEHRLLLPHLSYSAYFSEHHFCNHQD